MVIVDRSARTARPRSVTTIVRIALTTFIVASLSLLFACGGSSGAALSSGFFDFGQVAMGAQSRRIALTVTNTTTSAFSLSPKLTGSGDFAFSSDVSCNGSLQPTMGCEMVVTYTPSSSGQAKAFLDLGLSTGDKRITIAGTGVALSPGQSIVNSTDNPLVASYAYAPSTAGNVSIQFGPDTNYGLQTNSQAASAGAPVTFEVAGMTGNSTYHMRAVVDSGEKSGDQTFTTNNFTADQLPALTVSGSSTAGGIELMNPAIGPNPTSYLQAYAIDLAGNVIWGYQYPDRLAGTIIDPVKLLPNGDMMFLIAVGNNAPALGPIPAGESILLRETDLAGVPVRQITIDDINNALTAAGVTWQIADVHHDFLTRPNGDIIVLANTFKSFSSLPGTSGSTNVLGDVIVELDTNNNVVWTWNEFDFLNVDYAPTGYPDWTHSNALLYTAGDGNLLVSIRELSWIVKINYANATGDGHILWRLGLNGDFTLVNGSSPQDWQYGEHQPTLFSGNGAGIFELAIMDNGFSRQLTPGNVCSGAACYSTVPIFKIDESAKTATIVFRDTFPNTMYSFWGGSTTPLPNGNLEYDLTAEGTGSQVQEVTVSSTPTAQWTAKTSTENLYRANRIPSLYPGVQW
ncbi:MAG TPA: aryl-sulfate sulfotransferase [Candidatus Koribacter sp.]|jgi:hypothetical protein